MEADYVFVVNGLSELVADVKGLDKETERRIAMALNKTVDHARAGAARIMLTEVEFGSGYLNDKLTVRKRAKVGDLEATIRGRGRPTSLARFSKGGTPWKAGVTVNVGTGKVKALKKAFLVTLRAGSADIETRSNMGLAIRLPAGAAVRNKKTMVKMGKGLYLLYGPSVDQVFSKILSGGKNPTFIPEVEEYMYNETQRLMRLDNV